MEYPVVNNNGQMGEYSAWIIHCWSFWKGAGKPELHLEFNKRNNTSFHYFLFHLFNLIEAESQDSLSLLPNGADFS